jgi:Acyltransferase family
MESRYLPFVDWMKAIGIALIVYGHVAAATSIGVTPPIYPKQLGVAFFVFVTGYTLANERRGSLRVVYNRYFEVFLYAALFAIVMSLIGLRLWKDPNESNYLPLMFGINVFINDFPANPTTWYVGTYLHVLLLWTVIRRLEVRPWMLVAACASEIVVRAVLMQTQGMYMAYMLLSNWFTIFLIGTALGRAQDRRRHTGLGGVIAGVTLFLAWPLLATFVSWQLTFPFMSIAGMGAGTSAILVSIAISLVYISYTIAAYAISLRLPSFAPVRFVARNTVLVFIVHMPVYYALQYILSPYVSHYGTRALIEFLVCLPGLAIVSEALRPVIRPHVWRVWLADQVDQVVRSKTAPTPSGL